MYEMGKINFQKATEIIKKRNFLIAVSVFGLTMASIGFSYASFFSVKTNTSDQSITTGTLNVSYGSQSSSIEKTGMSSMSDEEGMSQTESSVIYIQNNGTLDSTYVMNIGYDMTNFTGRTSYSSSDTLTPLDYVSFAVYEYNGADSEDTLVVGPLTIADLPIYKYSSTDSRFNRYSILFDTLGSTSSSTSTKTYKIKTWLSDKAIPAASYTYFYINTEITAEVAGAKMAYTLNGTLIDDTSTLSGATISFHNNSIKTTTSDDGSFALEGIYPGVYNIDIVYNNVTYRGNLTVEEGTSNSLSSLGTSFTGTNIYSVANTYGTTLSKIILKNNLNTYSDAVSITSGSLMPTYKFIGGATENISGIIITLDKENQTFTMNM